MRFEHQRAVDRERQRRYRQRQRQFVEDLLKVLRHLAEKYPADLEDAVQLCADESDRDFWDVFPLHRESRSRVSRGTKRKET